MSEHPSLKDFEGYLQSVLVSSSDTDEAGDALRLLDHLRQFKKDFEQVRTFLK